jgi:hypothetical protein
MLDPDPETYADTKIRYKDDFHLIGVFSVQTVAEAELTPDVENSSLEQVSQLTTVLCVFMKCFYEVSVPVHIFVDSYAT